MKTRREFLLSSATAGLAAGAAVMGDDKLATAQEAQPTSPLDLSTAAQITQITMVVRDAEKVAHGFSEVFGPSWGFYEFKPQNVLLRDANTTSGDCVLRMAVGTCGGYTFKLVQPVSGATPHAKFLERNGEGFYSIGLGAMRNYDATLKAIQSAGVPIAMRGDVGDGSQFAILDTASDLGLRIEFGSMAKQEESPNLRKTGSYSPREASIFDMSIPVMQGGRRFAQLGLVVNDIQAIAKRYEQILGVRNWHFTSIGATDDVKHGKPLAAQDWPSATVGQGVAYIGGMQVELLGPVDQKPGGIHREFLDKHWPDNGFQHLMISPSTGGLVPTIKKLEAKGLGFEWIASVHFANRPDFLPPYKPGTPRGGYVDLEKLVGGFVLEWGG